MFGEKSKCQLVHRAYYNVDRKSSNRNNEKIRKMAKSQSAVKGQYTKSGLNVIEFEDNTFKITFVIVNT